MISCVYSDGVMLMAVGVVLVVVLVSSVVTVVDDCSLYGNRGDDPTNRNCHSPLSMTSSRDQTSPNTVYPAYRVKIILHMKIYLQYLIWFVVMGNHHLKETRHLYTIIIVNYT